MDGRVIVVISIVIILLVIWVYINMSSECLVCGKSEHMGGCGGTKQHLKNKVLEMWGNPARDTENTAPEYKYNPIPLYGSYA